MALRVSDRNGLRDTDSISVLIAHIRTAQTNRGRRRDVTPGMSCGGRALALGGGGVTGVAWETGLLLGLAEAGLDLSTWNVFVGTTAGPVVVVQLASGVLLDQCYPAR